MISFVPFPFSSSLRIKRAAGSWNDEEEELKEELVEEVKSAEQVDRVLQELEQKSCVRVFVHPLVSPSAQLSSHWSVIPSSRLEKCPTSTPLLVQNLLFNSFLSSLQREKARGPGNDRI